ncbi:Bcr/CflA family drug resistance efflux transporter [Comamonas serinivorans]|uniref:Bcr/CflA family efflux transporter n=1 Tax=Comamonas serinivorans TaxID=1082851 RepID=A0A1Y0EMU9_9BURK|nr:multidrug effflux MFS transporter [Comamonas serinivorans]ARU04916.1 Bcr/CflA family drug resistance efflux transporter [Comamonas serinivorans]
MTDPTSRDVATTPPSRPASAWGFALLLALLGMLGPFSIDTYIPAFGAIASAIQASPAQMQQTLSAYLFGFAFMNLFHGALSDSFGRRPVVLGGLALFTVASAGCALAQSIEALVFWRAVQGFSTGAGIVVSRAIIRDVFAPGQAQRVMSQVTIFFGIAPVIAPMIGGLVADWWGWHAVFWFLVVVGVGLFASSATWLKETLAPEQRQPLRVGNLMRGYASLCSDPRFLLLCFASGVPFNGMFLYVLSAPAFLGDILQLAPTQFFWFFVLNVVGIISGSWTSGRMAGKVAPKRQIRDGFFVMVLVCLVNIAANALFTPHALWSMWPVMFYSFGWALMVPAVTLLVLDLHPDRRGMASSLQSVVGSAANGIVAGVLAPLVMHSALGLAVAAAGLLATGLVSWVWLHQRWPEIGRRAHELT